ncbi:hypothetical protein RU639_011400 [Aspergillus parasiticus]
MSNKVSLDAVVSHIHDALSQEEDTILVPRDLLSTILDALTQSVNTEKALARVEADCLSEQVLRSPGAKQEGFS